MTTRIAPLAALLPLLISFAAARANATPHVWRIMPIGDSITEGGATFSCYRPLLAEKLRHTGIGFEFVGSRGPVGLRHEGYGGKHAEFLAQTVPANFVAHPADIVLLHAGHNHFDTEQPVPGIVAATAQLITAFRTTNPGVIVLLAQVIPAGKLPKYSYLPELNAELALLADRLHSPAQPVLLVDHATDFDWRTDTTADLVHPNANGAAKMAQRWFDALQPVFAARPPTVAWDSPSADARGSMPLGNGDIALNVWVEPSGEVLFYVGKSGSWEDNSRLAKVGLVRVRLTPALSTSGGTFQQILDPARGELVVRSRATTVKLWVDANHPTVNVEVSSEEPVAATASFELWRTRAEALPSIESSDVLLDRRQPSKQVAPTVVEPDTVLRDLAEGVGWYHHNAKSVGPVETMRHQDLLGAMPRDPILHRTFGAVLRSTGATRASDQSLSRPPATGHLFAVHVLTQHPSTPEAWLSAMRATIARVEESDLSARYAAHLAWWREFWARSHISITPGSGATDTMAPADVSRGYALQRFITACAGRGAFPIKFNGSLFTVPWPNQPGDADYRRWGPGYWWQNTRLPYAPLCTSGDFDLLRPFHHFYARDLLAVSRHRTERYFGFKDAAYFPEVMYFWGAVFADTYGRETTAAERTDKLQTSGWHKWEWVGGLELAAMLLDYFDHTGDAHFARETLLPAALPVLRFFDRFYRINTEGQLVMHPSQALETWWDTTNPMPEVAGLHAVINRLLELPPAILPDADRSYLATLHRKLPPLPLRTVEGVTMLAAAERFGPRKSNVENPELYAVFPFRLVSFEKTNAALGIEALKRRTDRGPHGWRHEDIFMAYLGLADDARDYVVQRARKKDPDSRFPAFWGPNYDWTPDQCHGGVLMRATQAMLLQSEGERIFLLPAWPTDWDVDFKLHAPRQTTVEARVRDGRLVALKVTPEARRRDVTVAAPFSIPSATDGR
jgi:alpha-L-fucosidase 2